MCPFPEHQRFRVIRMSRDQVIDIMTYNSYSLQYYSFSERKNRFRILETRGLVPVSWTTPIHTRRYSLTVDSLWKDTDEHGSF